MNDGARPAFQHLGAYLRRLAASGCRRVRLSRRAQASLEAMLDTAAQPRPQPLPHAGGIEESAPVAAVSRVIQPEGNSPQERIRFVAERMRKSPEVAAMRGLRPTMVFSTGDPQARLMLVGEAPGAEEERQGEPFVGPAGALLTKILKAMGLSREQVYISNIVKFRPSLPQQTTGNRKPAPEEMAACLPFLLAEIDVVQPRVIVALGAAAVQGLTGETTPVSRLRGRARRWRNGISLIVTFHPSYLLRNQDPAERRKVWEDMLLAMELLELPVSEKQRGFFRTAR
ncbi:MAG TPA: uracil-DNA glycosylase [Verrucomicrobiales bacterium]|nr:uracil-DNA glycosylase [Verrucomicrobiales bacterium]